MRILRPGPVLILAAFAAFLMANLIHNRFRVDAAIVPAAVCVGLLLWRPRRAFQMAAAILIALPALAFFKWAAVTDLAHARHFLNHFSLLLAGLLALAGGVEALFP